MVSIMFCGRVVHVTYVRTKMSCLLPALYDSWDILDSVSGFMKY